jgi:hypothetical protein
MNFRELIETIGVPVIVLCRQSGVSRDRMYRFMHSDTKLTEAEEQRIIDVLLAHGQKVELAMSTLRQVAQA